MENLVVRVGKLELNYGDLVVVTAPPNLPPGDLIDILKALGDLDEKFLGRNHFVLVPHGFTVTKVSA